MVTHLLPPKMTRTRERGTCQQRVLRRWQNSRYLLALLAFSYLPFAQMALNLLVCYLTVSLAVGTKRHKTPVQVLLCQDFWRNTQQMGLSEMQVDWATEASNPLLHDEMMRWRKQHLILLQRQWDTSVFVIPAGYQGQVCCWVQAAPCQEHRQAERLQKWAAPAPAQIQPGRRCLWSWKWDCHFLVAALLIKL